MVHTACGFYLNMSFLRAQLRSPLSSCSHCWFQGNQVKKKGCRFDCRTRHSHCSIQYWHQTSAQTHIPHIQTTLTTQSAPHIAQGARNDDDIMNNIREPLVFDWTLDAPLSPIAPGSYRQTGSGGSRFPSNQSAPCLQLPQITNLSAICSQTALHCARTLRHDSLSHCGRTRV